jgi:signal peptidase II
MLKKILILIVLDQITKLIIWPRDFFMPPQASLLGLLTIHPVKNFGLVFSLNFGPAANLAVLILAGGFFVYLYSRSRSLHSPARQMMFALILAGAASNLLDRLSLGYVRDFIDIRIGLVFNLADLMLVAGLILMLIEENKSARIII